jgi:hypothetical protein
VITATVETARGSFAPTELKLQTSRFNEAARLSAQYVDTVPPEVGTPVEARIDGELAGTLAVTDATVSEEGEVDLTARDAMRDLKNATVSQDFQDARPVAIAEAIADAADVDAGVIDIDVSRGLSPTFSATPGAKAAQTLARLTESVFFIDERNRLRFETDPVPATHTLDDLKPETAVGTLEQPYTEVRVFGSSSASAGASTRAGGRAAQRLITSVPPVATVGDDDGRQYTTRTAQARTVNQCERYARRLLEEFRRQRAEGTIVALGAAAVRPLDVVTLTPLDGSPRYIASAVTHRVSPRDGFVTEITPGRAV